MKYLRKFESQDESQNDYDEGQIQSITRDDFTWINTSKSKFSFSKRFDGDDLDYLIDWCAQNNITFMLQDSNHRRIQTDGDEFTKENVFTISFLKSVGRKLPKSGNMKIWIKVYPLTNFYYCILDGVPNPACQYWVVDNIVNLIEYLEDSLL